MENKDLIARYVKEILVDDPSFDGKLAAIKYYKDVKGCTFKFAKNYVEEAQRRIKKENWNNGN